MARPEIKLTQQQLQKMDKMAKNNCKDYTIANVLGIDSKTLKKHYSKRLIQKRAMGQADLRRIQRKMAKESAAMAIFLGKNELEQADKREHELSGPGGKPIPVSIVDFGKINDDTQ